MARFAVQVLVFSVFFCLFTPGKTQLPAWIGQLGTFNKTLSDLFKQLNATADGQKTMQDVYKALASFNFASIFESQVLGSLRGINLGPCGRDFQRISNSSELIQYLDAAGKPSSGLLRGNVFWGASVEQCRKIANSQICGSIFSLGIPDLRLGIPYIMWGGCFPSSCTPANVSAILSTLQNQVPKLTNSKIFMQHHGADCLKKPAYSTGAKLTFALCAILLLFCLIGSIIEMIIQIYDSQEQSSSPSDQSNNIELQDITPEPATEALASDASGSSTPRFLKSNFCEVFLCFSLIRNTRKIFDTKVPATAITSINGIRVVSIWWVILGHTFLVLLTSPHVEDKVKVDDDVKSLSVMPIANAYLSVDSFFFLSGLLVAYTCFRKMAKSDGKFNWILFYIHRFWRLTPSYMFVILFVVHLKRYLSDSPSWYSIYKDPDQKCLDYWWTNLLYINNFHPKEFGDECIGWSWYLANDMQFFIISPLMLILAFRYGWRGLAASAGTLMMISSIVTATLYGYYELDPLVGIKLIQNTPEIHRLLRLHNNYIYSKPYCRIQPYLVGFILGYAIYMKFCGPKRRGWLIAVIGWSAAFAVAMTLVYGPHQSTLPGNREWNKAENVFFGTLQRLLWGVVLAWVTYACHYGYGSVVQEFLSARFWIPLSRLTYSVYLVHLPVQEYMLNGAYGTINYDFPTASYYFIASTVLSSAVGFILAVVIEFPAGNLESLALKCLKGYSKEKKKYAVNS